MSEVFDESRGVIQVPESDGAPLIFQHPEDQITYAEAREWIAENPGIHHPRHRVLRTPIGHEIWFDETDRPVQRDVARERTVIQTYLEGQYARSPMYNSNFPSYEAYLQTLSASVAPMKDACRVSRNMPALGEGRYIYDAILHMSTQTDSAGNELDPDIWELNVFINRETGDNTVSEIQRFIGDFNTARQTGSSPRKPVNIRFIDEEKFVPIHRNVGAARKVATDVAFYRSLQRFGQVEPLYIAPEEADLMHGDPNLVYNIMTRFDKNPYLDILRGLQDKSPEIMMQNDLLFLRKRVEDFSRELLTIRSYRSPDTNPNYHFRANRLRPNGMNTGFSAEAMALAGGYDDLAVVAENASLGERITMLRGDGTKPNLDVVRKLGTRAEASPRRLIVELITEQSAYDDGRFADEELSRLIKTADEATLLAQISPFARINAQNQARFEQVISAQIVRTARKAPDPVEFAHSMMFWLGFQRHPIDRDSQQLPADYTVDDDGRIHVRNWSHVVEELDNYRARHTRERRPGERWGYRMI